MIGEVRGKQILQRAPLPLLRDGSRRVDRCEEQDYSELKRDETGEEELGKSGRVSGGQGLAVQQIGPAGVPEVTKVDQKNNAKQQTGIETAMRRSKSPRRPLRIMS